MQPLRLFELQKLAKVPTAKLDLHMMYTQIHSIPEATMLEGVTGEFFGDDEYKAAASNLRARAALLKASRTLQDIGPKMRFEMGCSNCGSQMAGAIQWGDLRTFLFQPPDAAAEE